MDKHTDTAVNILSGILLLKYRTPLHSTSIFSVENKIKTFFVLVGGFAIALGQSFLQMVHRTPATQEHIYSNCKQLILLKIPVVFNDIL